MVAVRRARGGVIMSATPPRSDPPRQITPGVRLVATLDMEGRINTLCAGLADLLGGAGRERVGDYLESLAHADVPAALFADMWRDLHAGRAWSGVLKCQACTGGVFWARLIVAPLRQHGRVVSYIAAFEYALSHQIEAARNTYQCASASANGDDYCHGDWVPGGLFARVRRAMRGLSMRASVRAGLLLALVPVVLLAVLVVTLVGAGYAAVALRAALFFAVSVAAVVLAAGLWWALERRLTAGLRTAERTLARMAEGDALAPIACGRDGDAGEVDRLLTALVELQLRRGAEIGGVADAQRAVSRRHAAPREDAQARDVSAPDDAVLRLALMRVVDRLVAQGAAWSAHAAAQVHTINRLVAWTDVMKAADGPQRAVAGEHAATTRINEFLTAMSHELDAIDEALAPTAELLSDADLFAFESRLLALNCALAHRRDTAGGLANLVDEARERAGDANRVVDGFRRVLGDLRTRLSHGERLLADVSATTGESGEALAPGADDVWLQAIGNLGEDARTMAEMFHASQRVADQVVQLAAELEAVVCGEPGRALSDAEAAVEGVDQASDLSLRFARTSAKISRLRPVRHDVGAPLPRIRRAAQPGQSLEDEWGAFRE